MILGFLRGVIAGLVLAAVVLVAMSALAPPPSGRPLVPAEAPGPVALSAAPEGPAPVAAPPAAAAPPASPASAPPASPTVTGAAAPAAPAPAALPAPVLAVPPPAPPAPAAGPAATPGPAAPPPASDEAAPLPVPLVPPVSNPAAPMADPQPSAVPAPAALPPLPAAAPEAPPAGASAPARPALSEAPPQPPSAAVPAAVAALPAPPEPAPVVLPSPPAAPAAAAPEPPPPAAPPAAAVAPAPAVPLPPADPVPAPSPAVNAAPEPGLAPAPRLAPAPGLAGGPAGVRSDRLPRIGAPPAPSAAAADDRPPLERFARPFENPAGKPLLAVLLRDTGEPGLDRAALAAMPFAVTFVIDPAAPAAGLAASIYRAAGQEVAILAAGLPPGATAADVEVTFAAWAQALPEAVAVVDPETAGFQSDRSLATQVVTVIEGQGRGIVSWDRWLNAADQVARREGVPSGLIYRRLDGAGEGAAMIRRYLDRAAFKAAQDGRVIVAGDTRPETVAALLAWAVEGRASSVALAPLTAALAR